LFIGESERYVKKALETGNSLHRGPNGEPGGGGVLFPRVWEGEKIWGFFFLAPAGFGALFLGAC